MRFWKEISIGLMLSVSSVSAQEVDPMDSAPFTSAIVCAHCHKDIHEAWTSNLHSRAATEPIFAQAFGEAEDTLGDEAGPFCLTCHAPTTVKTKDYAMVRNITKESVTCDFCHTMVAAKPGEAVPFELDVGTGQSVKRGPYDDADDSQHPVAFSELHLSAELCGSCHDFKTASGVPILSTYSEYLAGPYPRRNVVCQGCHMPIVMGNAADPKVTREPREYINLHRMPGGHAEDQLQRALTLKWEKVERSSGRLQVRLSIANTGAGHRVPTGMPTRKLILEVEVRTSTGKLYKEQTVYQKIVLDEEGREILKDGEMFTRAESIRSDNRILPGEQRLAGFSFLLPSTQKAELTARLIYQFAPLGPTEETEHITFKTITYTTR